jgi:hypothetical protein
VCTGVAAADAGPADLDGGVGFADAEPTPPDASVPPFDAGNGCPPVDAGPPPGVCNVPCPSGWTAQAGSPDVCCRDDGNGLNECFSQVTGGGGTPSVPPSNGGGPVPTPAPSAGRSCYGSASNGNATCGCDETTNGHAYSLKCNDTSSSCTCSVDGTETSGWANGSPNGGHPPAICGNTPTAMNDAWAQCGFPQ